MRTYTIVPSFEGDSAYFELPDIGFQGDHLSFAILFNLTELTEHWPNISPAMIVTDAQNNTFIAPKTSWDSETHIFTWAISSTETAYAGYLRCQMKCTSADDPETIVCMSRICQTRVYPSLAEASDPPEAFQTWIDTLVALGAEVNADASIVLSGVRTTQTNATAAAQSAADALEYRNAAQAAAQNIQDYADAASASATAADTARQRAVNAASSAESARDTILAEQEEIETALEDIDVQTAAATQAASQAAASATAAAGSASTAVSAKNDAETARSAAVTAKGAAEVAQGKAEEAETAAGASKAAAQSAASAASTSETNAASYASAASASATAAAASESNAADSETAAATSETNAANSATAAAASATAAARSETNAANSATAAASSESTVASDAASAVAAAAAASTSETNAAASASSASGSATSASNSASAASTSETNAFNSATAAAGSASVAQAAQTAAESARDSAITAKTASETARTAAESALSSLNSQKGVANGIAELDSSGKVPTSQLPSYVDDVLEYSSAANFPQTGESGKIYIDTTTNKTYRWSGSSYFVIASNDVMTGATSSNAGSAGLVPAPASGDHNDLLYGDGTWRNTIDIGRMSGTTVGAKSTAEGINTTASGNYSHAEGYYTTASGGESHAEGYMTTASGGDSHAEGENTTASARYSHAEGYNTTAQGKSQHVFGEYNVLDTSGTASTRGDYVEIVGNGTSSARSNARTLDWSGNEVLAGGLTINNASTPINIVGFTGATSSANGVTGLVPAPSAGDQDKFLKGGGTWAIPGVTTINGRSPNPLTGDITVIEGGGSSSYGSYRLDAIIATTDWTGNGPYTVVISNALITSSMDGTETWLDDETVMKGATSFTTGDGTLTVTTTVLPTATWSLHVALAVNGADVLADMSSMTTALQNGLAIIVNGDTASFAVPAGSYAYIKNNTHGLGDGLYTNTSGSAFPVSGGTADSTVFTAVSGGGLNDLQTEITTLNSNIATFNQVNYTNPTKVGTAWTGGNILIRRSGNVAMLKLDGTVLSATSARETFCKIPAGYRPFSETGFQSDDLGRLFIISSTGDVKVNTAQSAGSVWGSITYLCNR